MSSTVRWAGIALLAMLAVVTPARAADTTAVAPRASGLTAGRAGLGGLLGASWIHSAGDYAKGALPRPSFVGQFRYQFSPRLRLQVSPGFTWSAYTKHKAPPFPDPAFPADQTKQHYLTILVPVTGQLQWTSQGRVWSRHVGVGPGLYRVQVQNHRRDLEDPVTFKVHRGVYLGGTAEIGAERFFKNLPNTSVEVNLITHLVHAKRDDQFPAGWNDWIGTIGAQIGVNYYFDVKRLEPKEELPLPGRRARQN